MLATSFVLLACVFFAHLVQDEEVGTETWDASRSAGFAAYLVLWGSVITGMATHLRVRPGGGPLTWVLETHRILSALGVSFTLAHVVALLLDPVVQFSVLDGVWGFSSDYRPLSLGLGAVSQWLLVAVLATTALAGRMQHTTWRLFHFLSFPCWLLALLHSLFAGTDTQSTPALATYAVTAATVAAMLSVRVFGRGWTAAGEAPRPEALG